MATTVLAYPIRFSFSIVPFWSYRGFLLLLRGANTRIHSSCHFFVRNAFGDGPVLIHFAFYSDLSMHLALRPATLAANQTLCT